MTFKNTCFRLATRKASSLFHSLFHILKLKLSKQRESLVETYCPHLNQTLTFKSEQVYFYKNQTYCSDFTTYHLKVSQNDVLSFCEKLEDGILCKHHGIIGIYKGSYEVINQSSRKGVVTLSNNKIWKNIFYQFIKGKMYMCYFI